MQRWLMLLVFAAPVRAQDAEKAGGDDMVPWIPAGRIARGERDAPTVFVRLREGGALLVKAGEEWKDDIDRPVGDIVSAQMSWIKVGSGVGAERQIIQWVAEHGPPNKKPYPILVRRLLARTALPAWRWNGRRFQESAALGGAGATTAHGDPTALLSLEAERRRSEAERGGAKSKEE